MEDFEGNSLKFGKFTYDNDVNDDGSDIEAFRFELADISGKIHSLEQYAGTWLLLVFHRHLA